MTIGELAYGALKDLQNVLDFPTSVYKNVKIIISAGNLVYKNDKYQVIFKLYMNEDDNYNKVINEVRYKVMNLNGNILLEGVEIFYKIIADIMSDDDPGWKLVDKFGEDISYKFLAEFGENFNLEEYIPQCIIELRNVLNLYMGE